MPDPSLPDDPDAALVDRVQEALDLDEHVDTAELAERLDAPLAAVEAARSTIREYEAEIAGLRKSRQQEHVTGSETTEEELPSGSRLGDFEIVERLGAGAMGVVYRARQTSLGDREVALKILPRNRIEHDPRFADRFRREARLAATVHHPNLAEVYGFVEAEGRLGIAMRRIEGPTLAEALAETDRMSAEDGAALARGIASGLAEIHRQGLVHRDVKPSNVILERRPGVPSSDARSARPVLIDFGLLRPEGETEITGTRTTVGTPAFAAPEVQLGRGVDARSDVFSLGALLHDALSGAESGSRRQASAGLPQLQTVIPGVDPRLAAIVRKALEDDPARRYRDGSELQADLERFLHGSPVSALPTGMLGRLGLWARREPLRALRAGLVAVLLLAVGGVSATLVALTAYDFNALTRQARRLEASGRLVEAAAAWRRVQESAPRWLPGTSTALDHAKLYAPEPGRSNPWAAAILKLEAAARRAGTSAREASPLDGPWPDLRAAHFELTRVLFQKGERSRLHAPVQRFLLDRISPATDPRERILAMDAWTNYLIARRPGEPARHPPELLDRLRPLAFGPTVPGQRPEHRASALAAFASTGTWSAFRELVAFMQGDPSLTEDETEPVRRLFLNGATRAFLCAIQDPAYRARDHAPVLSAWIEVVASDRLGYSESESSAALRPVRIWSHEHPEEAARLQIAPHLATRLDAMALPDPEEIWNDYDTSVWDSEDAPVTRRSFVPAHGGDPDARAGNLKLRPGRDSENEPQVELNGTVTGAVLVDGEIPRDYSAEWGPFMQSVHPGRSRVEISTYAPLAASHLNIELRHAVGSRGCLQDCGSALVRVRIQGVEWQRIEPATSFSYGGRSKPRGRWAARSSRFRVPPTALAHREHITLVFELMESNTSWRMYGVTLTWDEPKKR